MQLPRVTKLRHFCYLFKKNKYMSSVPTRLYTTLLHYKLLHVKVNLILYLVKYFC